MPSLVESPPQLPAAGAWASLYVAQEPLKPRHELAAPAAVAKKPAAYGGRKKNLATCTEALGCETGAVDAAPAGNGGGAGGAVELELAADRKRRAREEEEMEWRARQPARRPLPPPLTTLQLARGGGASRVCMVHERRDGRLALYAVRAPAGVVEAERSGGRLRMRLLSLPACRRLEPRDAEAEEAAAAKEASEDEEEYGGVAKYVRGGRCVEAEGAAAAAARLGGKQWEPEPAAAFWVATS